MEVSNNTNRINLQSTRVNSKAGIRNKDTSVTSVISDAVRRFIDPVTLASEAYAMILKENNTFPIHNPNILLYDERLNLTMYEKLY